MRLFDERGGRPNTPIWKVMPDCEPARPTTLDQSAGQEGGEFGLQAGADEHQLTEIRARRPPPGEAPRPLHHRNVPTPRPWEGQVVAPPGQIDYHPDSDDASPQRRFLGSETFYE